jgi:glucose/arabinose dehydrogenase
VVQERDGLGDNLPSDYLIRVQPGRFSGWPYAYIGKHPMPGFAQLAPDKVEATITPDLLFTAPPRCSIWCSMRATSSRPNTRAACSWR